MHYSARLVSQAEGGLFRVCVRERERKREGEKERARAIERERVKENAR